jgi:glycine oxidase
MSEHFLIIGAGAVGLTCAQTLLLAGYQVTILERGATGQEASWAGGGIMSPLCSWDYSEAVTQLTQYSMSMFETAMASLHAETGIDPEYQRCGMLLLPPLPDERARTWCEAHQVDLQRVELSDPGLKGDGLLLPDIAQVRNPRLLQALRRHVQLLGGVIIEHCEVLRFGVSNDEIGTLHTTQGNFSADKYILTAGAWSRELLGELALSLDVRPIRGQILLFKFDTPPFHHILLQGNLYFIPRRDGHVLVGSTLEDAGFDKSITLDARTTLLQRIYALFPDWPEPVRHWAGLRPGSTDNIPTIGRHPVLTNLYANCGHFRYGVTMSLACAELLLADIEARPHPLLIEAYRWRKHHEQADCS